MRISAFSTSLLLASSLLLAGCSGEPDSEDIHAALKSAAEANMIVGELMKTVTDVEKVSCKAAEGKSGYVCDYKVTSNLIGSPVTQNASARFVEGDKGWEMFAE